jgi:hypothetical protein
MTTPTQEALIRYVGSLFGAVPGGYLGAIEGVLNATGGNMALTMKQLGEIPAWSAIFPGDDSAVALAITEHMVGESVAPSLKEWAVGWMTQMRETGLSWGEIVYTACTALEQIYSGPWALAGEQFRARASYMVEATNGWAAQTTDLGTLRDVYAYAISREVTVPSPSAPNPVPVQVLAEIGPQLQDALSTLGVRAGSQVYTISAADDNKAVLLGGGDDRVTVGMANVERPVFVSAGDGFDTLVLDFSNAEANTDFLNAYYGFFSVQPYRGFERIEVPAVTNLPPYLASIQGVQEVSIAALPGRWINLEFGSPDNGTKFELDLRNGGLNDIRFFALPPYNDHAIFTGTTPGSAEPAQMVDELSFEVTAGADGRLAIVLPQTRSLTVDVNSLAGASSSFYLHLGDPDSFAVPFLPELTHFKYTTNIDTAYQTTKLKAPLDVFDLSDSTGAIIYDVLPYGPTQNDGIVDPLTVIAPHGLLAFNWRTEGTLVGADTYVEFDGALKAGSAVEIWYDGISTSTARPVTQVVFAGGDYSGLDYFYDSNPLPLPTTGGGLGYKFQGSVFNVHGAGDAAVYFQGIAPAGKTLGNVVLGYGYQDTLVKVDGAAGINLFVEYAQSNGITTVLNTGSGSVMDLEKVSMETELGRTLNVTTVQGGRIFWADQNNNGHLDALTIGPELIAPYAHSPDFIVFETTDEGLATFNTSIQALGFNPIIDVFA